MHFKPYPTLLLTPTYMTTQTCHFVLFVWLELHLSLTSTVFVHVIICYLISLLQTCMLLQIWTYRLAFIGYTYIISTVLSSSLDTCHLLNLCLQYVNKPCLKQIVISTITAQRKSRSMQTTHPQQSCPWEPPACPPRAALTPDRQRPQQWLSLFCMILAPFHTATAAQSLFHLVPALGNSCKNDMTERLIIHTGQSHAYKLQVYNTHPHIQNTPTHIPREHTHTHTHTIFIVCFMADHVISVMD